MTSSYSMPQKQWTIIIYMNAESDLLYDSFEVFNEIAEIGSSYEVNILVVFDGFAIEELPEYKQFPSVYYVQKGNIFQWTKPLIAYTDPAMEDLSKPENWERIFEFINSRYPAEHTAFIYTGHGGAMHTDVSDGAYLALIFYRDFELVGSDEEKNEQIEEWLKRKIRAYNKKHKTKYKYEGYDAMDGERNVILGIFRGKNDGRILTFPLLKEVLGTNPSGKFAFLCLDCCWGMSTESSLLFKDEAEYLVASTDEMPSTGLGYKEFLLNLIKRPRIKPKELSNLLVSLYFSRNYADYESSPDFSHMGVSLTCTDLRQPVIEQVSDSLAKFSRYVADNINDLHLTIYRALHACKDYTYADPEYYAVYNIDFIWFLENVIHFNKRSGQGQSIEVMDKDLHILATDLIVCIKMFLIKGFLGNNYPEPKLGEQHIGARGITITFPLNKEGYEGSALKELNLPGINEWKALLQKFYPYYAENKKMILELLSAFKAENLGWSKEKDLELKNKLNISLPFTELDLQRPFITYKWARVKSENM
jgi:Clostripain family